MTPPMTHAEVLFQSAPGDEAGRNTAAGVICVVAPPCFNPLPAMRPGGTLESLAEMERLPVSIRSRR